MVWHFEISTYKIHSHAKSYQHLQKKKQQTLYYAMYEKKIIIIFSTKFTRPI